MPNFKNKFSKIAQIDLVLNSDSIQNSTNTEFLNIKRDLEELLKLSEENLLNIKKEKLLAELNLIDYDNTNQLPTTSSTSSASLIKHGADNDVDDLVSSKCRVYYECRVTNIRMHNALVMGLDSSDKEDSVRVVFCNPTQQSMKICDHFLNDTCKFHTNCKYSHGFLVKIDDLHEYLEYDHRFFDLNFSK